MTNGNKQGTKHDGGKPILGAIPPNAELAIGRVLEFGARKYSRDNWRQVDDLQTRYMDAALRHLNAVRRGEALDGESGEHHLAHAACCVLFMLEDALLNTATVTQVVDMVVKSFDEAGYQIAKANLEKGFDI